MRYQISRFALRTVLALSCLSFLAAPAAAQTGRVGGVVTDDTGQAVKGATVTAENPSASPSTLTATSDDKGRFSVIGMKAGFWTFTAAAPGYQPDQVRANVRTLGMNPPVDFKLSKGSGSPLLGAMPGVDVKGLTTDIQAADALYNGAQYDQAIAAYQAILVKAPALSLVHLQIGNSYRAKKEYDKAIAAYQEVVKSDATNEAALVAIGMTNLEKGDLAAAETTLMTASQGANASREVFYNLGEVKFSKNEPDEAAKFYQLAAEKDPAWGKPLFKLGLVALNKGDKAGAAAFMERVIATDPNSAEATQAKALIPQLK